jgi:hypothetical protein
MNLSRIIAGVLAVGLAYTTSSWSGESAKVLAADAMLAVANKDLTAAKAEAALANEIAAANVAALDAVKADLARQAAIAAKAQAAERKRAADLKTALKRIHNNAPKSSDGPVAPVLRDALDGLRPDGDGDAPSDPADANPSGAPADQSGAVPLPGDAPAT